ncbi:hypothetical protein HK097_011470 [Rhizophlyctis rosea]|uniref:Reelin domain-containing protein n=1 Tax=Rhizophlyctis rosea TaxID=64517 RepID=A0AAD5SEA5_9FUNG|nr:hypothetical protein HK097_011470 [Rhizophlyctis rosea]
MFRKAIFLSVISAFASVSALPTGAPRCAINTDAIQAGHGAPPTASLGYTVTVAPSTTGTNTFDIKVANSAGLTSFQGVLLYVQSDADANSHLGKFINLDAQKFHFQTDPCTAQNIAGDAESTITHSSSTDKPLSETVFTWQASDADLAVPGPIKVHAVVLQNMQNYQSVDPVDVPISGGTAGTAVGTSVDVTPMATPTPDGGGDVMTSTMTITVDAPTGTTGMGAPTAEPPVPTETMMAPTATVPMVPSTTSCTSTPSAAPKAKCRNPGPPSKPPGGGPGGHRGREKQRQRNRNGRNGGAGRLGRFHDAY